MTEDQFKKAMKAAMLSMYHNEIQESSLKQEVESKRVVYDNMCRKFRDDEDGRSHWEYCSGKILEWFPYADRDALYDEFGNSID